MTQGVGGLREGRGVVLAQSPRREFVFGSLVFSVLFCFGLEVAI